MSIDDVFEETVLWRQMQRFTDLAIVLKTLRYQERDRIVVCLTENHGKITGLAKGAVSSKRFGGTLDFLACSKIQFVRKPNQDMARIDLADIHHEFSNIPKDFDRLTAASFAAEFCMRLVESDTPSREIFVLLSNMLFYIDRIENTDGATVVLYNLFLAKVYKALGYAPSVLRCIQCGSGAHEIMERHGKFYWNSLAGGMTCNQCGDERVGESLDTQVLLLYHECVVQSFKQAAGLGASLSEHYVLNRILMDFLKRHVPGVPSQGFLSLQAATTALSANEFAGSQ